MNLKIGDIVKVVNEECKHLDKQGQVVGLNLSNKENPLRVWFGKECDSLIDFERRIEADSKYAVKSPNEDQQKNDIRTWDYAEKDLQKESDWSVGTLVKRHFSHMCHTWFEPKKPFVAGEGECEVEGCHKRTAQRIAYNVQGSVCPAEVCDKHAKEFHLKCMDFFPHKKASTVH